MIITGKGFKTLANGRQWYSYSGITQGGAHIPAFVDLVDITSTGLKDSYIKITPFYGQPTTTGVASALGIKVLIDDIEVYESQTSTTHEKQTSPIELFIPRQSKLTVKSINTAANTLQDRGVVILGWYS